MQHGRAQPRSVRGLVVVAVGLLTLTTSSHGQAMLGEKSPIGFRALDVQGRLHVLGEHTASRGACIVFLGIGCPISNELMPELGRLSEVAKGRGIEFFGVVSDPHAAPSELLELKDKYSVQFPLLLDANGELAERLEPTAVPEAFLHDVHGHLIYRGRVDDRSGLRRIGDNQPRERSLFTALEALGFDHTPAVQQTSPIGCAFEKWPEPESLELSWSRNVAPILAAQCVDCHRDGGPAPFSLQHYDDAARRSRMIARVAVERTMPPWKAAAGFGEIAHARALDRRAIRTLELWALSGAERGGPIEPSIQSVEEDHALGAPDLVIEMPEVLVIPEDGPDLFRAFVLPRSTQVGRYLRAIEFRPENPGAIRNAMLFSDPTAKARALELLSKEPGVDCSGDLGFGDYSNLAIWPIGRTMETVQTGVGRKIEKGSDLVLWLHAHPQGVVLHERSAVALWFQSDSVPWESHLIVLETDGGQRFEEHEGVRIRAEHVLEASKRLLSLTPRLGYLGMGMKVSAQFPDGQELPLLWLNRWDVFRPERYCLRSPIDLPAGTRVTIEARIDGSGRSPVFTTIPPPLMSLTKDHPDDGACCFLEFAEARNVSLGGAASGPGTAAVR